MSTSSPIPDHLFHSISPQKSPGARPELQTESDRLKLLLDLTNTLISNLECRDLLRAISASIRQVMHCEVVGVWILDVERHELRQLAMDFPKSKGFVKEDSLRPVEGSKLGRIFKTSKPAIGTIADFTEDLTAAREEAIESVC